MKHPPIRERVLTLGLSVALIFSAPFITPASFAAGTGGGFPSAGSGTPQSDRTPEERAELSYKAGLRYKKKAWKYEAQAATAKTEKSRQKLLGKAEKQYKKVIKSQRKVYQLDHRRYDALNELGYAYRKTGDYKNAMAAYNSALKMKPDFLEAIEYRAEALMALGYYEETKKAYMHLFRHNADLATQLMQAMQVWLQQQQMQEGDLSENQLLFADWVEERSALVGQSHSLSMNNTREW